MVAIGFAVLSWIAAGIAWFFHLKSKRLAEETQKHVKELAAFSEWADTARLVVRDKAEHVDVFNQTVRGLYERFRDGQAFKGATLLHDTNDSKVYVVGKEG